MQSSGGIRNRQVKVEMNLGKKLAFFVYIIYNIICITYQVM